jgi:hypothetical protein
MQTTVFSAPHSRFKAFAGRRLHLSSATGFFDNRIVEFASNLLLSSALWALLAVAVYVIYTVIVSH